MDSPNGFVKKHQSNDGIQMSAVSQPLHDIVYPPCVVQSIHEIDLRGVSPVDPTYSDGGVTNNTEDAKTNMVPAPKKNKFSCVSRISTFITTALETGFYKVGLFVGEYPIVVIVTVTIMCGLCGLGLKTFYEEKAQEKIWVPQTSRLIPEKAWVDRMFPQQTEYISILAVQEGGNIISPESISALMDYYMESSKFRVNKRTFIDLCVRVGPYCYVSSLLELWGYNETIIRSLSASDIITMVNKTTVSPLSGTDIATLLGGDLTYNEHGTIIAAKATQMTWVLRKEMDNSDAAEFEKLMIDMALKGHPNISKSFVYATRSFDDEGYGAINSDIKLLSAGFSIVFVFIMLSLGKFNLMEQKIYVSLAGMGCVGLALWAAYGLATAFGVLYSEVQSIMPFLLLGIGVDDMFVVIETWKNLSPEEDKLDIPTKMAITLSQAGMSITVTSVTDIVAFGISATTSIPGLSSFCIYATLGIFVLYILVSTVFAGVLALDERRRKQGRDACICCFKHDNYTPSRCSTGKSYLHILFGQYFGSLLIKLPVKVFVILLALTLASLGLWRFIQIRQDFDIINYLPSTSYAYSYARTRQTKFNRQGVDTKIYCGGFSYFQERAHLQKMHTRISESPYIQSRTTNSWFTAFNYFIQKSGQNITSDEDYNHKLYTFLQTLEGQRFASFIKLNSSVEPVSILASYIDLRHLLQPDSAHDVLSMDNLRNIIDSSGLPKFTEQDMPEYMCFSYCIEYMSFETNKVLQDELYRNLGLSAMAVFVVTLILIANLWTSLLVFVCVIFTMFEVGGALEIWGVTIDTASSILLILSVGLAVDYSAHIGHTFMTISGSRNNRVIATLRSIGPAVFNGGLSTFLAFVLLANSASYGFQVFFRVFFLVVLFGLFNGLVFLPVILSLVGSKPYKHSDEVPESVAINVNKSSKEFQFSDQTSDHPSLIGYKETLSRQTGTSQMESFRQDPSLSGTNLTSQPHISVINLNMAPLTHTFREYVNEGFKSLD